MRISRVSTGTAWPCLQAVLGNWDPDPPASTAHSSPAFLVNLPGTAEDVASKDSWHTDLQHVPSQVLEGNTLLYWDHGARCAIWLDHVSSPKSSLLAKIGLIGLQFVFWVKHIGDR